MRIGIDRGTLTIDIAELLDGLTDEDRLALADSLSVMDSVIEYVAQQIVDGWTEAGSHGMRGCGNAEPTTPLDKAIRTVALGASEVAAKDINDLVATLKRRQAYHEQVDKWAWRMWHMMNDARRDGYGCPQPPSHPHGYLSDADAYIVVRNPEQAADPCSLPA